MNSRELPSAVYEVLSPELQQSMKTRLNCFYEIGKEVKPVVETYGLNYGRRDAVKQVHAAGNFRVWHIAGCSFGTGYGGSGYSMSRYQLVYCGQKKSSFGEDSPLKDFAWTLQEKDAGRRWRDVLREFVAEADRLHTLIPEEVK